MTTFDAKTLSKGWLSAAIASGSEKSAPVLHKTVCVEQFNTGVRLVATDSYMLLTAWVPAWTDDEIDAAPEPGWDEVPDESHVAADTDGRARSLMDYLHTLSTSKDTDRYEVALRSTRLAAGDGQGMFENMAATAVQLEFPGVERVTVGCVDFAYPDWRKTLGGFAGKRTDVVALHPDRLKALAKLGKLHGQPVLWEFGGRERPARIEVGNSDPRVAGLVMPVRWDWDRAMPADDTPQTTETTEP